MISMQGLIERAARLNPQGLASRCGDREQDWASLAGRVARLAGALQALGLGEGERVAVLSLNSDRYYETVFATCWAGGAVVPLNTRWALPENRYAMEDCAPQFLFFDSGFSAQAEQLVAHCSGLRAAVFMDDGDTPPWARGYEALVADNSPVLPAARGGEAMAGIFYTGGTTGFPKGVMQSHRGLWSSAIGAAQDFSLSRSAIYLHAAPMFHIADFAGSMGATLQCAGHVMLPAFDAGKVLASFADDGITHTLLVPSMIKMLLAHPEATTTDISQLDKILYGASPMPAATLEKCMALWPGVDLVQAYGQTELAPVATTLSPADHRAGGPRLRSAGRPTAVSDVRIVAEDGSEAAPGESGEVVVRGPHAMLGYWNKPEQTADTLREGWVHTGDAGYFDPEGYLFIVDRVKDMIVSGGENVYTTEVENALMSHTAVQDCAVIGIPHEEWGEAVHAIVILKPDASASAEELITHCRGHIAGYKLPKSVDFRSEPLPLSGAGKVLKTELRKPYWAGSERNVN
ncbi:long-chain-fatty-acid--CoA ligase [Mangrovimicrobium sediminis]|uniref:Long-chain-fatty-acid--CoA ligase n=1 Tax=Mangrovimicrobium sediminis TaxID=2562682 RepID=A0A4Z0M1M3_9GAMM|nr:long-chain fatty acid--CoA ligase [Haliea sp. SAOS-164]TGD73334.1 long-chain-fatty-acid--CoA ligase [Haliea sp. SAOS-164]